MSVIAYTGLPGSGKSYSAVHNTILPAIRKGLTVVTNLPVNFDLLRVDFEGCDVRAMDLDALKLNPDSIFELCPNGAVVLIDEAYKLWPSGTKTNQVPDAFKSFLTEHRHRVDAAGKSQEIVLICQDLAQMASFARQLVETTYRSVKLTNVGLNSRFRVDVYNGPMTGPNPPRSQRLREIFYKYDEKTYRYYNSHTMSQSGKEGADEAPTDRRSNLLLRPIVLTVPLAIGFLIWFGVHQLNHAHQSLFGERKAGANAAAAESRPLSAPDASGGPIQAAGAAVKSVVSPWRVSAVMDGLLGGVAVLEDGRRAVWVPLRLCRRMQFDIACRYRGRYWSRSGAEVPDADKPL